MPSTSTFKELCNGLRTHDPSITELSIQIYNRSRLGTLLNALEENMHVSSLTLDLNGLPDQNFRFSRFCRYLSESRVLRSVTFTCKTYTGCSRLPRRFVRALTENSLIEEVSFSGDVAIENCYEDLLAFIQGKAKSLMRLSIPFLHWTNELGQAIGSLQVLECFSMIHLVDCPLDLMLQRLQPYRCLRKLSIAAMDYPLPFLDDTIAHPLSSFLCSDIPLESLELKGFMFSRDQSVPLLDAMLSCSTLVRLVLTGELEVIATREMEALFRQPRESSLRELCLGGEHPPYGRADVSSILTPLEGSSQQSSAGSLLQVLELYVPPSQGIQSLLAELATKRSQLRSLSLGFLDRVASEQLSQFLPDMMSLRNLNVKYVLNECSPDPFLRALRQNGSLHAVCLSSISATFSTDELLRIQSYCDRNRWATGSPQKLGAGHDEDVLMHHEDATLLPSLLHAVKPAGRMAPSAFLGSLVACDEAIGPHVRAKRVAFPKRG
jgi:hypothetical protein